MDEVKMSWKNFRMHGSIDGYAVGGRLPEEW